MNQYTAPVPAVDRFWPKVDKSAGPGACWPWTAGTTARGYGIFHAGKYEPPPARTTAHRYAYFLTHGPLPADLNVCHHCDNPPCCNPAHLFLGSQAVNMRDMATKGRGRVSQTHCKYGHEFTPENTRIMQRRGSRFRSCIQCRTTEGRRAIALLKSN